MRSSTRWRSLSFVYDAIIITMMIIFICVRCNYHHHNDDHHHLCTMRSSSRWQSSSFVYDAIIMMTIIIIRVRCDHHHLCTVLLSWFVYDAIIIDHHDLCTMWSSSFVYDAIIIILTPRIQLSVRLSPFFTCIVYSNTYDAIIIICVRCNHYDDNHHQLCTMRSSSRWRSS